MIRNIYILTLLLSMAYGECVITGCSGQICAEESTSSDSAYLDWYACFQYSECGNYGLEGDCSWLTTDSLINCLDSFGVTVGCTDPEACNYNLEATVDDGSCLYYDCAGTCGGYLEPDCCGVCGGDNSQCSNCCGMPFPDDCSGVCCSEVCYDDYCGVCDGIPENDCVQDCAGTWGGNALLDNCGICDSDPSNDCGYECGSWGGDAFLDECGVCNGDGPEEHHDCDGNCLVEFDCTGNCCVLGEEGCYWQETGPCGEPGPSNGMDSCGVCGGDNSSCADCAGVPCSDAYVDNCGTCDDDPTNDCVQGCDGVWGGGSELDECGICGGDGSSCADSDGDGCIDDIDDAPFEWDDDYDGDGIPDDCEADDDNDGASDPVDSDDNNEYVCSDVDGDTCDDCSFGMFDPANDGPDMNGNGICDQGDIIDSDGDGVIDEEDSDPNNPYQCSDNDGDGCDDCGLGYYNPADDGSDYDADGICDLGDDDDDNDGVIDSEDCHPFDPTLSEYDCCGVCGGDNASCSNCCGIPFNDDCTSDCYIDYNTGDCCYIEEVDECGICYGDNACLGCEAPFIDIDGHCLHDDDIAVLQGFIDNSLNSGFVMAECSDPNDPWCASPNLYMDQSWHDVIIDGVNYQFSNNNGEVEPLELGLQDWVDGRLTSLMCGAYIYCQLSGDIPENISDLTEIEVLRLEVNYFSGAIPESICELENINFLDDLYFNFSYNRLCPPYPECVEEGAVQYMDISECEPECDLGDVNCDGQINVIDIVLTVGLILENSYDAVGDVNEDDLLNVIDVVMLVNWVLNGTGCSDGSSWDYDMDGICDVDDADDDNDGALDPADSDDNNEYVCSDVDGDTCDDCSSGTFDPTNDGPDMNGNGICDEGDANNDTDGDGVIDDEDSDPNNPYQCSDVDGDACEDCSTGIFNPSDDGWDYDGDGSCDVGDNDDDDDGALDPADSDDNNEFECSDHVGDTCDDCSTGHYGYTASVNGS